MITMILARLTVLVLIVIAEFLFCATLAAGLSFGEPVATKGEASCRAKLLQ